MYSVYCVRRKDGIKNRRYIGHYEDLDKAKQSAREYASFNDYAYVKAAGSGTVYFYDRKVVDGSIRYGARPADPNSLDPERLVRLLEECAGLPAPRGNDQERSPD
ncbi:MAG TPA: hypothetical protein VNJ47_04370 [Nevskiales bacterium]|nr:hypothetical protein [Nevskiales bacterium]